MLQSNQKIIRHKVGLLNLIEELGRRRNGKRRGQLRRRIPGLRSGPC